MINLCLIVMIRDHVMKLAFLETHNTRHGK